MYEPLECVQRIPYPHTNIISLGTWREYGYDELAEGANVLPELGDRFEIGDMFETECGEGALPVFSARSKEEVVEGRMLTEKLRDDAMG